MLKKRVQMDSIKNSWKYEKDLTILNLIDLPFTIIHKDNILLPNWAIKT